MVLAPDQQRVCSMLKDTITLLCKNGLTFKSKFSVEAVIGVTIDDEQMFHISVNEIIKSSSDERSSELSSSDESGEATGTRKRKRKKRMKTNEDKSDSSDDGSKSDSRTNGQPDQTSFPNIKGEPVDEEEDSADIVFVKQERDDSWTQSSSHQNFQNFLQMSTPHEQQQHDHNFTSLSELDLTPVTASNDTNLWPVKMHRPKPYPGPAIPRTATVTAMDQTVISPMRSPGQAASSTEVDSFQVAGDKRFTCHFCSKTYAVYRGLRRHQLAVHFGQYPHNCNICGQGFMTRDNMKGHMSSHTEEMSYKCEQCMVQFKWKAAWHTHKKKYHTDVTDMSNG